jgi:hypothetical protein
MLRRMALVRSDDSEEPSSSIIRVVVPSSPILVTLIMEALGFSKTSAFTRVTRRNIPEDAILQFSVTFTLKWWQLRVCRSGGTWNETQTKCGLQWVTIILYPNKISWNLTLKVLSGYSYKLLCLITEHLRSSVDTYIHAHPKALTGGSERIHYQRVAVIGPFW